MCSNKETDDTTMRLRTSSMAPPSDRTLIDGEAIDIQAHIGTKLKALYSEVVNQPVPARLLELLKRLEGKDGGA